MSAIRSALKELVAEPNDQSSVDELVGDIEDQVPVRQMVDVLIAGRSSRQPIVAARLR